MARVRRSDRVDSPLTKHVALVGFMGAGKTTLGEEAARAAARPFRDLDHEIELALETSIASYFAEHGEEAFREQEAARTVSALRESEPSVLSLGGGAVTQPAVREALREHAVTVLVDVDADTAGSAFTRPTARSHRTS